MKISIDHKSGVPFYRQIIEQIKFAIARGDLTPGDRLPTVRQLAVDLSINPNTVIRAYRELEHEGLLATRRGAGVYISSAGSRLTRRERTRILTERVDVLLAEARQMDVTLDELLELVRRRDGKLGDGE